MIDSFFNSMYGKATSVMEAPYIYYESIEKTGFYAGFFPIFPPYQSFTPYKNTLFQFLKSFFTSLFLYYTLLIYHNKLLFLYSIRIFFIYVNNYYILSTYYYKYMHHLY